MAKRYRVLGGPVFCFRQRRAVQYLTYSAQSVPIIGRFGCTVASPHEAYGCYWFCHDLYNMDNWVYHCNED